MFGLAAGFYRSYLAPAKLSVLFLGIDDSGKTTLLERVKVTQFTYQRGTIPEPPKGPVGKLRRWHSEGEAKPDEVKKGGVGDKREENTVRTAPASPGGDIIWLDDGGGVAAPAVPPPTPATPSLRHTSSDPVAVAPSTAAQRRRSFMRCPAPRAYSRESMASADRDEYMEEVALTPQTSRVGDIAGGSTAAGSRGSESTTRRSDDGDSTRQTPTKPQDGEKSACHDDKGISRHRMHVEYDLKKGAKMLPMHAIRPTLGQNLGKVEACGCKLEILDLGGSLKMRPLWDRYLSDVDAVVFVVDASPLSNRTKLEESVEAFQGILTKLQKVWNDEESPVSLEAGVPILVFANKMDMGYEEALEERKRQRNGNGEDPTKGDDEPLRIDLDKLSSLFCADRPNIKEHDTQSSIGSFPGDDTNWKNVILCGGSAKTGEGVRAAFEWLIPTAKLAQRERQKLR